MSACLHILQTMPGPDRVLDESTMTEFLNVLSTTQVIDLLYNVTTV
jgi:hypothetical protein